MAKGGGGPAREPEQALGLTLTAMEAAGVSGGVLPECDRRMDWRVQEDARFSCL